jgi:rod shape-determining protein MreB
MFRNRNFAIDLGNNNTLVTDGTDILLQEPSYIVFNANTHDVKAVGDKAFEIYEKAHEDLKPVKPLRGGVIADYESAARMIRELVRKVYTGKSFFSGYNNIVSGVPYSTTEVERRALRDALDQFNSRNTYLLYEPLAAAVGMGLDIRQPEGKLIIDIGGGITEIVVISLSGIAAFQSLKVAGDAFDENIRDYFRRQYNLSIGIKTAEQVKWLVGSAVDKLNASDAPAPVPVRGKDLMTGIPITRTVSYQEIALVLDKSLSAIETAIIQTLETCPPELAADIYESGIHLTGGSALLRGLRERLEKRIKLAVHLDKDPLRSVTRGIGKALHQTRQYQSILLQ